ncbi:MAG: hypothetical protein IKW33_03325 [Clostridia bacterium]|nr:hypothetical protein [Clostridia bacterium]
MVEIKEVLTKKDVAKWAKYPLELYKDCPYYVPNFRSDEKETFDPKKNLDLKHCDIKGYLAYKDGKLVGRILAILNHKYNQLNNAKTIRFSRFECINDIEVFTGLLGAVAKYGKENGMEVMHGPWGFNDTDREGMLTFGFDERSTYATNYYYPYFAENMVKLGFEDESKWVERRFSIKPYERIYTVAEKLKKRQKLVDIAETMSVKKIIKQYGKKLFDTINDAYGHLDGYVPYDDEMRDKILSQFGTIVNSRYLSVLVNEKDEVAAFGVVFPSICNALIKSRGRLFPFAFINLLKSIKNPTELEMALIGVKKEYKNSGINSIVIARIMKNVVEDGITNIESNPMLETNFNIQQQWKFTENKIVKKRQTYKVNIKDFIKE